MARPVLRILIVDDSPEDRLIYRRLLAQDREHEYLFLETDNGEEGLGLTRTERPDCLLLDYRLPDLDGLEFLSRLPAEAGELPPPVIVLTGQGNEAVAVQAMKSGAQDYLLKDSISAQGLHRAVHNALEKVALRGKVLERTAELSRANTELKREMAERERAERQLQETHAALEVLVRERTAELSRANAELKREIAERKRAEEERALLLVRERQARRQAEEANRVKDEFLATLSHELRTPLNAILGWAQILRTGTPDAATTERALEKIERNARAQAQLIAELLDVSRIITGNLRLEMSPVELPRLIEAAFDSVAPAAEAKGITVRLALDPLAPMVLADPSRLQQVVWNLLSNAIKFTPRDGCVEVRLAPAGREVRIAVSDTGMGIAADFLPYVFDRFRQADSTTTRRFGGLGLGLAIVRHLVELHGGTVEVESQGEGQGTMFTVLLPVQGTFAQPAPRQPAAAATPREPRAADTLAGLLVLVVEDEEDIRNLLRSVLELEGYEVVDTGSGLEGALRAAR
ncbi:MAG: response regulator, partial [Acidobacteriota bacterium]|nr:response regulator [Acidobacteriota bacterium]